jgi:curved DNA-binding protein CbpA
MNIEQAYTLLNATSNMSLGEIKTKFYDMAMIHHPDRGGNLETMQRLVEAYDYLVKNHKNLGDGEFDRGHIKFTVNDEILAKAVVIKNACEDLDVSICGAWIWVTGERLLFTESLRTLLKANGYKFSPKKLAWYYAGCKSYSRKNTPLHAIYDAYGKQGVYVERDNSRMIGGAA